MDPGPTQPWWAPLPNFYDTEGQAHADPCWHPKGPDSIEIWSWVFTDRAAPPEVKEAIRLVALRAFSPAGTLEQDDMDNWEECTRSSRGVVARRQMLNYQMGLGHDSYSEEKEGLTSEFCFSDNNQRQFYKRWSDMMSAALVSTVGGGPQFRFHFGARSRKSCLT